MLVVMPNDQAKEKEREVQNLGAELKTVPPVPFKNENHFYHTAKYV
jgi:cysteine synthase A